MIGQQYGQLTVISQAPSRFYTFQRGNKTYQNEERRWLCRCSCGNTKAVAEHRLKKSTRSCGCSRLVPINIGDTFGRLTIIGREPDRFYGKKKKRNEVYRVRCECGKEETRVKKELCSGSTIQCSSCARSGEHNSNFKHGGTQGRRTARSETPEYRCWKAVKTRCYNPNFKNYPDYGGRGIRVCERWLHSFENFLEDMGLKPSKDHSIERRNPNGDYCPSNCYWTTDAKQRRNKRSSKVITFNGKSQCLVDWLKEMGTSDSTYRWRIKHGWSEARAIGLE